MYKRKMTIRRGAAREGGAAAAAAKVSQDNKKAIYIFYACLLHTLRIFIWMIGQNRWHQQDSIA